jgi:predicted transcriptional regulator
MLLETDIPIKYKATVMQKLNILESMDSSDQEYYKIKTGGYVYAYPVYAV